MTSTTAIKLNWGEFGRIAGSVFLIGLGLGLVATFYTSFAMLIIGLALAAIGIGLLLMR